MKKITRAEQAHKVASEFSIELMFALAKYYHTTIEVVMQVFDKTGYWKVINDDELMWVQAHSGEEEVIEMLKGAFDEVLSRNK